MKDNFTSTITKEFIPYQLPNNWKWFWWSDLISNYQQGMIRSNSQLGKGNAEYLKMGNLDSNGRANFSSLARTEANQKEIVEFSLKEGDFLINVRNSKELVGKTCIIENINNRTVLFNHMLVRMDHGSVKLNQYINAFLNIPSSKKMLDRIKQGTTTVIALYQRDLNKLPISLPDSETFNYIVNFYKSINAKIELNNRINTELETMAKTLYDYWFVQFDFPYSPPSEGCPQDGVGIGKPYKTSGGKMVWNEELKREIPEGWESGVLSDIANITMGQSPPGESYNEDGIGMIFYQGCTDFGNRFPTIRKYTTSPTRFAKQGDILLSVRAPVGTLNISKEDCCIGRGLACMNSKNDAITYLFGVMVNLKQTFDRRNASGTTFGSITKDDLFSLPVVIPNEKTLSAFQNLVFPTFEKQNKIELENIELASLRDWLLPMLMNGQVKVVDAEEMIHEQLGMVAETSVDYQSNLTDKDKKIRRKMLATYIINQSLKDTSFGKTKFEKLLHLIECHIVKGDYNQRYSVQAAGPYDGGFTKVFWNEVTKAKWFKIEEFGKLKRIMPAENHTKSLVDYGYLSDDLKLMINDFIGEFKNTNYERPEIVSTLYAVWNNRIIRNEIITDELLKKDFLEWDAQKARYKDRLDKALEWMRENGIIPDGWGSEIRRAKK